MDATIPFHPAVVHFPVALGLLMPLIALGVHLFIVIGRKDPSMWWLPVAFQVVLLFSGVAAMVSGEHEEEKVEQLVDEDLIENHEGAAKAFMLFSALALIIMGAGVKTTSWQPFLRLGSVVILLGGAVLVANAGKQGGELVYIHGAANAYVTDPAMQTDPEMFPSGDDDDDDGGHEGREYGERD